MKIYSGYRGLYGVRVTVQNEGRPPRALKPRNDLRLYSWDGFEWGYVGFRPAQLSLAILADHLGNDQRALKIHQDFTREVVAFFPFWSWELTSRQIQEAFSGTFAEVEFKWHIDPVDDIIEKRDATM